MMTRLRWSAPMAALLAVSCASSGAFRAGDTARLAKALAVTFDLSLGRSTDGNWTLSRANRRPQSAGG